MHRLVETLIAVSLLAPLSDAHADARLSDPEPIDYYSRSSRFVAHSDPRSRNTTAMDQKTGSVLWSIAEWFRVGALADDGEHFIAGWDGGDSVPVKHPPDMPMLRFYRKGQLIATVTLASLISEEKLIRTASHYWWGTYLGFDPHGRYQVRTVEGVLFSFDVAGHLSPPSWMPYRSIDR